MITEEQLLKRTKPASDHENYKQKRTERMISDSLSSYRKLEELKYDVYAKGSYANNTNVRLESDVDIAVEMQTVFSYSQNYAEKKQPKKYEGLWTPDKLRGDVTAALIKKFGDEIDTEGSTAIKIHSGSGDNRVDADVVPCFTYKDYRKSEVIKGVKIFKKGRTSIITYPKQQLENGIKKNKDTNTFYKHSVRLLKNISNHMAEKKAGNGVPSYFIECLVYNVPNEILLTAQNWTERITSVLYYIVKEISDDWIEVNKLKKLFGSHQEWDKQKGEVFAKDSCYFLKDL